MHLGLGLIALITTAAPTATYAQPSGKTLSIVVPQPAAIRLNKAFVEALKDTEFQAYVTSTGMELANSNSLAYLNQFYAKESALYQGLAKAIGVEAN